MGDLLSAASLLLAVVGIFFGLWYGEITESLALSISPHIEDRPPERRRVKVALYGKALPIALTSVPSTLIFLPDGIFIVSDAIAFVLSSPCKALASYDAVRTTFCFIVLLLAGLGAYATILVIRLRHKLAEIDG